MSTQLQQNPSMLKANTLFQMALDFLELIQDYNYTESEIEQLAIEREVRQLLKTAGQKFDNAVYVLKQLQTQVQYFKNLADEITTKAKVAENAERRLKNYLIEVGEVNSQFLKGEVFKGSLFQKNSVEDVDLEKLPDQYKSETVTVKVDKRQILRDAEKGNGIPGVRIIEKTHIRIH